jgi:hypothetical protein
MIQHTVVFRLRHAAGSCEERDFLDAARALAAIPRVEEFECLRQVSDKNPYNFGLSMMFRDDSAYQAYNEHPIHRDFVSKRWLGEVEEYLEIDYQPLLPDPELNGHFLRSSARDKLC